MQIKRFEAADMTEALRMVKREFGDDAVILSAKEVKPRGFFSTLKKRHVEITAATDYPTEETTPEKEFTGLLARQLEEISSTDRVSLSKPSPRVASPTTEQEARFRPKPLSKGQLAEEKGNADDFLHRPAELVAASPVHTATHRRRMPVHTDKKNFSPKRFPSRADGTAWCTRPFYSRGDRKQIIALVGPSGAGKSTALAKLAWHCRTSENQQVGLLSLDRYRMAANSLLERFAKIMELPLHVVRDADELQSALRELAPAETVIIDTPGMGPEDRSMMEAVRLLLDTASPDETHLVVNAAVRPAVMRTAIETYRPLNPNRVLFTHLDEVEASPSLQELLEEFCLSSSFLTYGVNLHDGLKTTTMERLQIHEAKEKSANGRIAVFPDRKRMRKIPTEDHLYGVEPAKYLANRNSELFHEPDCKSVKRINTENILAFNSIEEALSRGFKPCRACCNIDTIRKMVSEGAAVPRARAM